MIKSAAPNLAEGVNYKVAALKSYSGHIPTKLSR